MRTPLFKALTLLVLAATCAIALADTPTRVGRISLTQGQVTIGGEQGEESNAAVVNWPSVSRSFRISAARDRAVSTAGSICAMSSGFTR